MPPASGEQAIFDFNRRGLDARERQQHARAAEIFREAIGLYPREATLYNNLAVTLEGCGDTDGALAAYSQASQIDPALWPALFGAANQLIRKNDYPGAEALFERTLAIAPDHVASHLAIYELAQIRGDRSSALLHQAVALTHQQVFTQGNPAAGRSVLCAMWPGDWQANVPVDLLFDRKTTTWHKFYLLGERQFINLALPPHDIIFNAIAEADDAVEPLKLCEQLAVLENKPVINKPASVLRTNRAVLPGLLESAGCHVPPTVRLLREQVRARDLPFGPPFVIRPVGSHAGRGLEKIEHLEELDSYLEHFESAFYYVTEFVDYRNEDGYFRKYRIILVDGVPFPFHMAISQHWMVHYYNAPMAQNAWMRAEEERWMAGFEGAFTLAQQRSLRDMAKALDLEYFGVDCAIGPDGRVLVFEADPGVIVHVSDPVDIYPYKHTYVPRIFAAVERMLDTHIARSR
ncbi:MAG: tetratricopeptide repeat protein [Candidatus Eremiobacteraeota bacterium]|nr:tetratricopeptide repeat protein [Candidatus Eremiobacteraeota bacterium]